MHFTPPKLRRFGMPAGVAGAWRALYLTALIVILACDGPPETGIAGPNAATVGTATRLVFTVEPNATTATAAIFPAVKVTALNASGSTATDFRGKITMAIGTNPTGAVLQGTTGATAVNGVATFSSLIIGKAGTGYTLTATSGKLTPDTSAAFNVALPAKQLIFSVQPSTTSQGATISPAVQVTALDKNGDLAEGYRQDVTVAIGTNPGAGALAGTRTVTALHGVATFSDLRIDKAGSGYTLLATSLKLADTSAAFDIANPSQDLWTTQAPMSTARGYMGTAAIGGMLYAIGGTVTGSLGSVEAYDPGSNTWTTKTPLPEPRSSLGAAVINGTLYAVGGQGNGPYLSTLEAYDPGSNTWSSRAPMPTARAYMGAAAINGTLYVAGGAGNSDPFLVTLEAYDPISNTWTTKAPMPTGRNSVAAAALNGILYVVGGSANSEPVATVEAYNPGTDSWTTKAPMPAARHSPAVAAVNGILYAVGGASEGASSVATVYAYDPVSNTWSTKASMPTARYGPGAATLNGILYSVGGFNYDLIPDGGLKTLEAYHP